MKRSSLPMPDHQQLDDGVDAYVLRSPEQVIAFWHDVLNSGEEPCPQAFIDNSEERFRHGKMTVFFIVDNEKNRSILVAPNEGNRIKWDIAPSGKKEPIVILFVPFSEEPVSFVRTEDMQKLHKPVRKRQALKPSGRKNVLH